ncbi:MAG: Zn-dependent exopeptidase M28 [Chlorobi bacterium]|nr:Zn-dependent exopeptidase M28 [Chlorobiota bacterium]
MRYFHLFIFLFYYIFQPNVNAQDVSYAKQIINELCSSKYYGRGYVKNADLKAAKYLRKELKLNGVSKYGKSYFQHFHFPINTFPSHVSFALGNKLCQPGKDYLVMPVSSKLKGNFDVFYINKAILHDKNIFENIDFSNKAILFNPKGVNDTLREVILENILGAKAIIELIDNKLIYRKSQIEANFISIRLKKEAADTNAQTASFNIKNKFITNNKTQNVIGFIPGQTDSLIVFTAHYDHLGMMGKTVYFPGANDNGSGTSMVLNLAKYYASFKSKPKYSMAFIFFSGEEVGLLGSKYFTENPLFPLEKIKFLINLDLVGTGEKGIMLVNGKVFKKVYERFQRINAQNNYLSKIAARGKAANSDHYYFSEKGVKAFFIYTMGGIAEYHNIYDKAETLPLTEYSDLFSLLTDFVKSYE